MIKFKSENIYNEYITYSEQIGLSYESIKTFSEEHQLNFGIIKYDDEKDTLYICTNTGECQIDEDGLVEIGKGDYSKFTNGYFEDLRKKIMIDIDSIVKGNKDIICINSPILEV